MKNKNILIFLTLLFLATVAYADNYDAAKKLMEADKEVKELQQCKINKGWWCKDDSGSESFVLAYIISVIATAWSAIAILVLSTGEREDYRERRKLKLVCAVIPILMVAYFFVAPFEKGYILASTWLLAALLTIGLKVLD
jgi:hypothetical protein